jgi:ATP-binding cassette subfamily A (ABC1) protein 3
MSEGQLRCVGSSLFLKKTYGVGYQLTIEKQSKSKNSAPLALHSPNAAVEIDGKEMVLGDAEVSAVTVAAVTVDDKLQDIVSGSVPNATLLTNVGTEMSFQLPLGASSSFTPMFEQLDAEVEKGGIVTYGVGITTLDEVFLLVARGETNEKKELASSRDVEQIAATKDDADKSTRSRMDLENEGLFVRHVGALFRKRAVNFKRDKKAWVCTTILPTLFVLVGFLLYAFVSPVRNLDPYVLDMEVLNVKSTDGLKNPIPFNSGTEYSCQPGSCIYDAPLVMDKVTGEAIYSFCGVQSDLGNNTCSFQEYEDIMQRIIEAGAEPVGDVVMNVSEV